MFHPMSRSACLFCVFPAAGGERDGGVWLATRRLMTTTPLRDSLSKPALRVEYPSRLDTDIGERIVRALQDSELHVFAFCCLADHPDYPPDSGTCTTLVVTAVTDGERGFLVMTEDFAPTRSDVELAEFMNGVYDGAAPGDDYVSRVATLFANSDRTPGALDLTDPSTARSVIESAYEEAFAGKKAIDHGALFEHFARLNVQPSDEAAERQRCRELDSIGPAPA
jgi:hypothetical protein